ncbi:SulP family inorganic anion transporter [Leucothrix pacifica]|uniref:Sodium-independent anion transporter n=1 Tax=Leucothrix pacifica TaxID=1247513 RepID=A0A317CP56_9GAMM|nr:SulP family inorganic anion transporter [Leucothrix pacifica]PWR00426.1 sodium-independent anion transporter [Leucothrix pacifica]
MNSFLQFLFPFIYWLPSINKDSLKADLLAGITGAVIVLPQGVAFATIAGLPPEYGLYTAMVTPIIAALFGSSLHLISGPTTAISIVIFSTLNTGGVEPGSAQYIQNALTITFLAGVYQLAFALARLGVLVNFVSHTVVIGFTAGAAILIASSQMKYVLGVEVERGSSFLHTWVDIFHQLPNTNWAIFAVSMTTLVTAVLIKRFMPKVPNMLVALIVGGILAIALGGESVGINFVAEIPARLPPISSPDFSLQTFKALGPQAFAVALLGLIEAVSISRAIASKSHQRIDGNQEFFGQGMSNVVGSFFSSYAGSGSFTRSGVNYSAGAQTPLSAIFAAVILAAIILLVAPYTRYLPTAAMGGIILVVAYSLVNWGTIRKVFETSRSETSILLTTFFATLFLELEFAIYLGVMLSLVIFLARTSIPDVVSLAPMRDPDTGKPTLVKESRTHNLQECPQLKIIRVDMSVYFGSANHIQNRLHYISEKQGIKHILVIGTGVNFIDMTGAEMIEQESDRLQEKGGGLYFAELKPKVNNFIHRGHFDEHIGAQYFFEQKKDAINKITTVALDHVMCQSCQFRVFKECDEPPLKGGTPLEIIPIEDYRNKT